MVGSELQIGPGGRGRQSSADGVENAESRLLFEALGDCLFRTLLAFLWLG
jgi:hypothetical protein